MIVGWLEAGSDMPVVTEIQNSVQVWFSRLLLEYDSRKQATGITLCKQGFLSVG